MKKKIVHHIFVSYCRTNRIRILISLSQKKNISMNVIVVIKCVKLQVTNVSYISRFFSAWRVISLKNYDLFNVVHFPSKVVSYERKISQDIYSYIFTPLDNIKTIYIYVYVIYSYKLWEILSLTLKLRECKSLVCVYIFLLV